MSSAEFQMSGKDSKNNSDNVNLMPAENHDDNNSKNIMLYWILCAVTIVLMTFSILCGIYVYAFHLLHNVTTTDDQNDDDSTSCGEIDSSHRYVKARVWLNFSNLLSTVAFATICHSQLFLLQLQQ